MAEQWDLPTYTGTEGGDWNLEDFGDFFTSPITIGETFAGSPQALWQAARIGSLPDTQAYLPQYQRAAMAGYQPAFGSYIANQPAGTRTFSDWLTARQRVADAGTVASPYRAGMSAADWNALKQASRYLSGRVDVPDEQLSEAMLGYRGILEGENARSNAMAMASAAMGGGVGYGARAARGAVGNLYDLYAARAAAAGQSPAGFMNWLGSRYNLQTGTDAPTVQY